MVSSGSIVLALVLMIDKHDHNHIDFATIRPVILVNIYLMTFTESDYQSLLHHFTVLEG